MTQPPTGIVYLVGAGPGDPGLITARGLELLRSAEVLVYDYLVHGRLIEEAPEDCERIYVGKRAGAHTLRQEEINALLVEKCRQGRRVVRLKGGDPFVFGRGGEEALELHAAGCTFEIVPGVTAGVAAPAYAGIPVSHRGLAVAVTFVTGHEDPTKPDSDIDWQSLARGDGTLVFYMGVGNLPAIARRLIDAGRPPQTPAAVIQWGTYSAQKTVSGTLTDIAARVEEAGLRPPAVTVIGAVARLREQLSWFERRPLLGRRILVTRSRAQASDFARRLEELGAEAVEFPTIRIVPPEDPEPLKQAVREASKCDWLVLTSVNAVDAFFEALRLQNLDARSLGGVRVCAIGPATAARLAEHGIRADLVPACYVAESVLNALSEADNLEGRRILMPRSDIGRSFLPDALRTAGACVNEVTAYRTVADQPENLEAVRGDFLAGRFDALTFASSSTVRNFANMLGDDARRLPATTKVFSIGPQTSETLREHLSGPIVEAREHTIEGLIEALLGELGAAREGSEPPRAESKEETS